MEDMIGSIPAAGQPLPEVADSFRWVCDASGCFSVKSAISILSTQE